MGFILTLVGRWKVASNLSLPLKLQVRLDFYNFIRRVKIKSGLLMMPIFQSHRDLEQSSSLDLLKSFSPTEKEEWRLKNISSSGVEEKCSNFCHRRRSYLTTSKRGRLQQKSLKDRIPAEKKPTSFAYPRGLNFVRPCQLIIELESNKKANLMVLWGTATLNSYLSYEMAYKLDFAGTAIVPGKGNYHN